MMESSYGVIKDGRGEGANEKPWRNGGNLYVTDSVNHTIRKLTISGSCGYMAEHGKTQHRESGVRLVMRHDPTCCNLTVMHPGSLYEEIDINETLIVPC